ncbi:MAG TPA: MerR family transcriptional regulator [Bryobacteraceae bacterium]|nr:MerR family transcriptional regulator [Bryobacteraceae bacterium]
MKAREFAELAGVTVRTLHHYDRLGLLRPRRNGSGYRVYAERDLERLEQIVALKFLGLPLGEIRGLLDGDAGSLSDALRMQREVLEDRRRLLDRAIGAIAEAERNPQPALLRRIIEVIGMQENTNWTEKYYSPEARAKIAERGKDWTPEKQEESSRAWLELFRDVEAAIGAGEDPAGSRAQALAARWRKLVEGFTGGDAEISAGLRKLYADQAAWPAEAQEQMKPFRNPKVWAFMNQAMGCGK